MTIKIDGIQATSQQLSQLRTDLELVGRHAIPWSAGGMRPTTTAGCAPLNNMETGSSSYPELVYLAFNYASPEYAIFSLVMPESWDLGPLSFKAVWSHPTTTSTPTVAWDLQAVARGNADTLATAYGSVQTVVDTGGSQYLPYFSPESGSLIVAGTPAAGDKVFFRVSRQTGHASDVMTAQAYLTDLVIYYNTNKVLDT